MGANSRLRRLQRHQQESPEAQTLREKLAAGGQQGITLRGSGLHSQFCQPAFLGQGSNARHFKLRLAQTVVLESDSHWESVSFTLSSGQEIYYPERIQPALNSIAKNRGHQDSWQPTAIWCTFQEGSSNRRQGESVRLAPSKSLWPCTPLLPEPFPHTLQGSKSHCLCPPQVPLSVL